MEDWLKFVHNDIKDTLKFSETKNAALLTFFSVNFWALLKIFKEVSLFKSGFLHCLSSLQLFLIILFIICILISFLPNFKKMKKKDFNPFYFSDIETSDTGKILEELASKQKNYINSKLVEQIISLSYVIKIKIMFFKYTLLSFIFSTAIIGITGLIYFFLK